MDADRRWRPDVCADLTTVEFLPGSIEAVYCSHTLEHLSYPDARSLLQRIARWLVPGGTVWIAVPDFGRLCEIVAAGEGDTDYVRNHFYGNMDEPWNPHRSGWTRSYLTACLVEAGFVDVREFEPWVSNVDGTGTDASGAWFQWASGARCTLSLNLTATRGGFS